MTCAWPSCIRSRAGLRSPRLISTTASAPSRWTAWKELNKILDATGGADDLNLIVRMAVSADGAAYTLSGKFGVSSDQAPALLLATRQAVKEGLMGVSFHVGSQCMRPTAYQAAMAQVGRSISRAGVIVDIVDVGGGFPSVYPGMVPPDMSEYADAIHRGFNEMPVSGNDRAVVRARPGAGRRILVDPGPRRSAQGRRPVSERRLLRFAVRRDPLALALPDQAGPGTAKRRAS